MLARKTTKETSMFTELTHDLLDLTATTRGEHAGLFAAVIDCCSCCCCGCMFFCR
jgi:hypothetical protein